MAGVTGGYDRWKPDHAMKAVLERDVTPGFPAKLFKNSPLMKVIFFFLKYSLLLVFIQNIHLKVVYYEVGFYEMNAT